MNRAIQRLSRPLGRRRNAGVVMILGLIFIVVLTLLSIAMFRSVNLEERIAGNTRDKHRAQEAAESALRYGEWWLMTQAAAGLSSTGEACNGTYDGNKTANMKVCTGALANPADPTTWPSRIEYLPTVPTVGGMTANAGGGKDSKNDVNYQGKPALYINYLGLSPDYSNHMYQITAYGQAGNADTASIVRSTFQIRISDVKDLGGL